MLTVACVLKSGGIYTAEHVANLHAMVKQFVTHDRFVCISDVPVPCERIEMVNDWPRWWGKCELFRRKLFTGPVLYIDLDDVLVAPFEFHVKPGEFWMVRDFYKKTPSSTMMAWWGEFHAIYNAMPRNPDPKSWDQNHIAEFVQAKFMQDQISGIYSWKADCKNGIPADAKVISFHGNPKPWDIDWRSKWQ